MANLIKVLPTDTSRFKGWKTIILAWLPILVAALARFGIDLPEVEIAQQIDNIELFLTREYAAVAAAVTYARGAPRQVKEWLSKK